MERNDIGEIIDNIVIVPDTNILLYLYKCSFNTSQNIVELLNKVKEKMIIPSRVNEEYHSHKDEEQAKIDRKYETFTKDLIKLVKDLKGTIGEKIAESRKYDFPDCDALEIGINNFFDETSRVITTYDTSLSDEKQNKSAQISNVEQLIRYWESMDKILPEPNINQIMEYVKEGEFRYRYKMPPGYMDEEKEKEGRKDDFDARIRKYGDLFVWKEIIDIGKSATEKTLLFLTNDVKEDWWILRGEQKNREAVRMREELRKEYIVATGSDKIEFMTLPKFYELFSSFYESCDINTILELDCQEYVRNKIYTDYRIRIEEEIEEEITKIEWTDIDTDFDNVGHSEVNIDEIQLEEISLHYDDDGEAALYDIKISAQTYPIDLTNVEHDMEFLKASIELKIFLYIQIQRDLLNLEEDAIIFKDFNYEVISNRDAWEVYLEAEENGRAEANDTLEDYYNH